MPASAVCALVARKTAAAMALAICHDGLGLGTAVVTVLAGARFIAKGLVALGVHLVAPAVFTLKEIRHVATGGAGEELRFRLGP